MWSGLLALLSACSGVPDRPNVLVIVADDMGYGDLGFMGNTETRTPNLDGFFERNIAFLRHYTDASCQPTRAGMVTGMHPVSLGYAAVGYALPDGVPTVAERLKERGYHTAHVGKWHLGYAIPEARPPARGFDEYFGFLDQGFLAGPGSDGTWRHRQPTYTDPWLGTDEEEPRQYQGHLTDLITEHAVERIEGLAGSDDPWFMNLWYYAPHDPLEPAPRYVREETPAGRYRALVEHLDDSVGEVLAALEASGAAERTVVVFLSDNGGTNRYLDNNAPLPGEKVGFFEGGIRTPMAIRVPWRDRSARIEQPVSYLDIVPTILEWTGAAPDASLPGRSLLPALEGESLEPRPMFWELTSDVLGHAFGVTTPDGRWHFGLDLFSGAAMLNDLENDPSGRVNLIRDPAHFDALQALRSDYRRWHNQTRRLFTGRLEGDTIRHDSRDVQRTPGFNSVTWALAIDPGRVPARAADPRGGAVTLAAQDGVGRVELTGDTVRVHLFGDVLTGVLPGSSPGEPVRSGVAPACHTITVSTYTEHPNILSDAETFRATLYIDGRTVDGLERAEAVVRGPEHDAPLELYPADGALLAYRVWTEYLREQDTLRQPGVQRVTAGLCPTDEA